MDKIKILLKKFLFDNTGMNPKKDINTIINNKTMNNLTKKLVVMLIDAFLFILELY